MRLQKSPLELGGGKGAINDCNCDLGASGTLSSGSFIADGHSAVKLPSGTGFSDVLGIGKQGGTEAQLAALRLPDSLPCLNYNNSIENDPFWDPIGHQSQRETGQKDRPKKDRHGRTWATAEDGVEGWLGALSTNDRKRSFEIRENVKALSAKHGIEKLGFLTLTFRENLQDPKEAQKRFNSLASNVLRPMFADYMMVVEPQSRGAIHYHLLVVCREDIRTGFDFCSFVRACESGRKQGYRSADHRRLTKIYASSAGPELKYMWRYLRNKMPLYGFGRYELLPIKSNSEAISKYVGGYLDKGSTFKGEKYKNVRMVRYSRGFRTVHRGWTFFSEGSKDWRKRIGEMAFYLCIQDMDQMKEAFGKTWAFRCLCMIEADPMVTPLCMAQMLESSVPPSLRGYEK